MSSYSPKPGSIPFLVCKYFKANPEEHLSNDDIALKFDVDKKNVLAILQLCENAGLLHRVNRSTWAAGARLAGFELSTPPAAPARTRAPSVPFDASQVTIIEDRPIPAIEREARRISQYELLYQRMKPGSSVDLTYAQMTSFKKWASRNNAKLLTRQLGNGVYGCWKPAE